MGIGTLLEDGLGDTIRVSLTEDPEFEIPVAKMIADRYENRKSESNILSIGLSPLDPFAYHKRQSLEVGNLGGKNVPRVVSDFSEEPNIEVKDLKEIGHFYLPELDKWQMNDQGADYIYTGNNPVGFMLPNGLKEILNYSSPLPNVSLLFVLIAAQLFCHLAFSLIYGIK